MKRGYYMAAGRYEIYLRALTNVSRVSEADERILFNKRGGISYLQAAI